MSHRDRAEERGSRGCGARDGFRTAIVAAARARLAAPPPAPRAHVRGGGAPLRVLLLLELACACLAPRAARRARRPDADVQQQRPRLQ